MKTIPYGKQQILEEDIQEVVRVLRSDFLTCGPEVPRFEAALAAYLGSSGSPGSPEVVACANGTAALHLAAMALGVNAQSRVIVTPLTFSASANCIRFCGGQVTFADIDPQTLCLDPQSVRKILQSVPRGTYSGIVVTDFAGHPADWPSLRKVADDFGLWLLEDACHALGAEFQDSQGQWQSCGGSGLADLAVFSFHPVKHVAMGEGGAIAANKAELAQKLRLYRSHGIVKEEQNGHGPWYQHQITLGYNYRLTEFQAALGTSQLKRMKSNLARRQQVAKNYFESFKGLNQLQCHLPTTKIRHAYHLFVVETEKREALYHHLKDNGIHCQIHYLPVHMHPDYRNIDQLVPLAHVEAYYWRCLSLPMYHSLSDEEQDQVVAAIKKFQGW